MRIAPCRGIGKETFLPERTTRTSPPSSSAIPASRCSSKIPRKAALAKHIGKLPEELRRSLTWDQGKEMHAHKRFTVATDVQVYFCDPRSPWQPLGTPASASRRSAAATIAARASAPRAIVAPCTAPNDKAWGATPAPRHADQPGLHDRPDCRRRA